LRQLLRAVSNSQQRQQGQEEKTLLFRQLPQAILDEQRPVRFQTAIAGSGLGAGDIERGVGQVGDYGEGGMTNEFVASSGNHCIMRTITIGNRSATDAIWDETPSDLDIQEAAEFHVRELSDSTGAIVEAVSVREANPEKMEALFRKHLGGGKDQ
jgi:hypothetical protein